MSTSGGSAGNPHVGQVASLWQDGVETQAIATSSWDQLSLSHWTVRQAQAWATIDGDDYVIDKSAGTLVDVQLWCGWAASAVVASRGLLVAHSFGGNPTLLDDHPTVMTPANYAAIADFESSMNAEGINRIDPVAGLRLNFWAWQDSGGALNLSPGILFVTVLA